jgi:hypothetical protein
VKVLLLLSQRVLGQHLVQGLWLLGLLLQVGVLLLWCYNQRR